MNAVVLDEVCKMNLFTRQLNSFSEELPQRILDKHYLRKHGKMRITDKQIKGVANYVEYWRKEFWFVVGSQHLYGEEALREVKKHAQEMVDELNENGQLPYPIRLQELAVTADTITKS